MTKRSMVLVSGVLLTAGVIAALAAPPRGSPGEMWGQRGGAAPGGMRGWFGPRSITADEYDARTRERFARLDKNGDGIVDAAEIEAAIASQRGRRDGGGQAGGAGDRLVGRFGDKDGKITKDAFLTEAKRRFAQLDLNNDGKITDEDLPPMMRGKGFLKANGPSVQGMMGRRIGELREADAKQDGVITQEAFLAAQAKRFEGWDRNKDSVVDKSDFDAMRTEMSAYRAKRFLHAYGADADGKVTKDQFYKVAKERFARLDRNGEGKITLGGRSDDGDRPGMPGRGGRRGSDQGGPDRGPMGMPGITPKN